MAILYVWSGAAGTASGADWTNAKTTLTTAYTTEVAGDTLYVAHDHNESSASSLTLTSSGTAALPTKVICVDRGGTVPPVSADRRTTAQVSTTGASNMTLQGTTHYDGIIFSAGSAANIADLQVGNAVGNVTRLDNCSLRIASTNASCNIVFANNAAAGQYAVLNNTTMSFGAVTQNILATNTVRWCNTPSALLGTIPTLLLDAISNRGCLFECFGVDLSAAGSGKTILQTANVGAGHSYKFVDCKLNAAVTKATAQTAHGVATIDFIRCGAAGNYSIHCQSAAGLLIEETTIVRTGGASDGTTPIAWKIVTTANCTYTAPYECPPIAIWNDTTGSAKTATVEGIWSGGAVPNDDEVWLDVEYLGDASSPQGSFVNDGKADLIVAAAAQTAGSGPWPDTGYAILDTATATAVTLSGGNLVATNTGTTSFDQGAKVGGAGKTTGKYYFEVTITAATGGNGYAMGIGTPASTYSGMGNQTSTAATTGVVMFRSGGNVWANGSITAVTFGARSVGNIVGIAVDLDNRKMWLRISPAGNWNNNASYDPVTNVGGVDIPAGAMVPYVTFGGTGGVANNVQTANFGATAFSGVAPTGFANWLSLPGSPFKLACTFTPQQRGWIYARVKCAKASSTFYIDPLITLT